MIFLLSTISLRSFSYFLPNNLDKMFDDAAEFEPVVVVVLSTSMKFDMETDSPSMMKDTVPSSSSFTPSTTPERVSLLLLLLSLLSLSSLYFMVFPINADDKDI